MDTAKKLADALRAIMGKSTRSSPGAWGRIVCPRDAELELGFQALAEYDALPTPAAADAPEPVALTDEQIDAIAARHGVKFVKFVEHQGRMLGRVEDSVLRGIVRAALAASQPAPVEAKLRDLGEAQVALLAKRADEEMARAEHYKERALRAEAQAVPDIPEAIAKIIQNLHTQDNRITDNPLFAVQEKRIVGGMDDGYEEGWCWISEDSEEIHDDERIARLNALFEDGHDRPEGCRRVGYVERWEFVTGALTEQGCKDYIACNGHNLTVPRIYAYGSYRNAEWKALRSWLMSLRAAAPTPSKGEA